MTFRGRYFGQECEQKGNMRGVNASNEDEAFGMSEVVRPSRARPRTNTNSLSEIREVLPTKEWLISMRPSEQRVHSSKRSTRLVTLCVDSLGSTSCSVPWFATTHKALDWLPRRES